MATIQNQQQQINYIHGNNSTSPTKVFDKRQVQKPRQQFEIDGKTFAAEVVKPEVILKISTQTSVPRLLF